MDNTPAPYNRKEELKDYSTRELVEELRKREGVEAADVDPYVKYEVIVGEDGDNPGYRKGDTGPAVLFIVID
jgi:hypothetical protein